MTDINEQLNNPLHGLKLDTLLNELITHYGWDILAEYTRLKCFKNNPSTISSLKFLRKTDWAREKLERFYLYDYKNLPEASEEEFDIPPRQRIIPSHIKPKEPKILVRGEAIAPLSKDSFKETHRNKPEQKRSFTKAATTKDSQPKEYSVESSKPFDPYANAPK